MTPRGTLALALWAQALSCVHAPSRPVPRRPEVTTRRAAQAPRATWRALEQEGIPAPLQAIATTGSDAVVLVARGRPYLLDAGITTRLCDEALDDDDEVLEAATQEQGVLLLGAREQRAALWRVSRDGRCAPLDAPPIEANPHRLRITAHGARAWIWSAEGTVFARAGEGATWTRLPRIEGLGAILEGPDGETWAAAAPGPRREVAALRVRLWRLVEGSLPRWEVALEDRAMPVATTRVERGSLLIADAVEVAALSPAGPSSEPRWLTWERAERSPPTLLAAAGTGTFIGAVGRSLYRVDLDGGHPLGEVPTDAAPSRLAVSPSGTVWAMDADSLWRRDGDRWSVASRRALRSRGLVAAAARGRHLAVALDHATLAISADDGASWSRVTISEGSGRLVGLAINGRGTTFALRDNGAALGDGRGMSSVLLPGAAGTYGARPAVFPAGDRWILLRRGVWTSDDDGATWQRRLPVANASDEAPRIHAMVFRGGVGLALDADLSLWRSDDAAANWRPITAGGDNPASRRPHWNTLPPQLAWDGRSQVAVFARGTIATSDDLGRRWEARDMPLRGGDLAIRRDGVVLLSVARGVGGERLCEGAEGSALLAGNISGFSMLHDMCEHLGEVFAYDAEREDEAVVFHRGGDAWRVRLDLAVDRGAPTLF